MFFLLLTLMVAAQGNYRLLGRVASHDGESRGGVYLLTISQDLPDGGSALSGGDYTLHGGVWIGTDSSSTTPGSRTVYLPLILR